jgi:hypothetical protein
MVRPNDIADEDELGFPSVDTASSHSDHSLRRRPVFGKLSEFSEPTRQVQERHFARASDIPRGQHAAIDRAVSLPIEGLETPPVQEDLKGIQPTENLQESTQLNRHNIIEVQGKNGHQAATTNQVQERKGMRQRGSFLENIRPNRKGIRRRRIFLDNTLLDRNTGNDTKRKHSQQLESTDKAPSSRKEPSAMSSPTPVGSFGRRESPREDINLSSSGREPSSPGAIDTDVINHAEQIWRSRRHGNLTGPGLADLWIQSGGQPFPEFTTPLNSGGPPQRITGRDEDEDSADDEATCVDGIAEDLSVRTDMQIIPTYDGFKYHVRQLNPRVSPFLLERITQEQLKRYKRLVDLKLKHSQSASASACRSKSFCSELGGEWKPLPPRAGSKHSGAISVCFMILAPWMTEDALGSTNERVAAQFPPGIPLPPVESLPAEFECPLCFKVKRFYKPSDWTKHVYEDIQPYTCTFSGCIEPKSFKRKADLVRHENERHRQLESWTCNVGECTHTCYRKDNFVQHLVREHKVPEPGLRIESGSGSRSAPTPINTMHSWQLNMGSNDDVWALADECHRVAAKQPRNEPCKFCGNISTSWKKLTVHLVKHMEQIAMPILQLIEKSGVISDSMLNPTGFTSTSALSNKNIRAFANLPNFLYDEPEEMEAPGIAVKGLASNIMHSYPPAITAFQSLDADVSTFNSPPEIFVNSSNPLDAGLFTAKDTIPANNRLINIDLEFPPLISPQPPGRFYPDQPHLPTTLLAPSTAGQSYVIQTDSGYATNRPQGFNQLKNSQTKAIESDLVSTQVKPSSGNEGIFEQVDSLRLEQGMVEETEQEDDARTTYSDAWSLSAAGKENFISEFADMLLNGIRCSLPMGSVVEDVSSVLPKLLKIFALKFGHNPPGQVHRDVMFFIHKNRE